MIFDGSNKAYDFGTLPLLFRTSLKRKKNFLLFFEIDLSNRLDLAQIDLNPVFPSKIIDFRLKSIPIDDASVNARLTDIIAEYET